MFKFFRNIRRSLLAEGRATRYLAYAVGEIVLVVVGILIALQLNNWNQNRITLQEEKKIFEKVLGDLDLARTNVRSDADRFTEHQLLHRHLYQEIRGEESYNDETNYHLLRLTRYYNPIITENHLDKMATITNDEVREALNDYIKEEKETQASFGGFNKIKMEMVRPFSEKHGMMNADVVFREVDMNWANVRDTVINVIQYDKLKAQFGSEELDQILASLWLNTGHALYRCEVQIEQIQKLEACLEKALNNE